MEENRIKALVMQAAGDTALLLCQGGQLIRTKNISGWKVGEEVFCDIIETIENIKSGDEVREHKLMRTAIKIAACFMLVFSGILASRGIPVHSEQLMDCIEVKTNIYGKVIEANPISEQGEEVLKVIGSNPKTEDYQTDSIAHYRDTIKRIISDMKANEPISELTETDDFAEYYDELPEELKEKAEEAVASQDQQAIDEAGQEIKNEVARDLYETDDTELQLAYDLFGYMPVRNELYSLGTEGHDLIEADTTHAADIYIPFCGINMQSNIWGIENIITLFLLHTNEDPTPDYGNASVYLYDLTDNEEATSKVIDNKQSINAENNPDPNLNNVSILIDSSAMTPYHSYYIKLNGVILQGQEIDNIYYVFTYVPEGAVGFEYELSGGVEIK